MPKIIVHFRSPESVSLEFTVDEELKEQHLSYLIIFASLIRAGKCKYSEALKDSCVILQVERAGGCEVDAKYGNLKEPELQLEVLANFLKARANMGWQGIPQIWEAIGQLRQMIGESLQQMKPSERAKQRLTLPGMASFNVKNILGD